MGPIAKDEVMEYAKYDRITDDVFSLSYYSSLKFTVILYHKTSKNKEVKREHYYKEYEYQNYNGITNTSVSVKRSFEYFLSLESSVKNQEYNQKSYIRIGPNEYFKFKEAVEIAINWFRSSKYSYLYKVENNDLIMVNPIPSHKVSGFPPQNKYIHFVPTIIDRGIALNDKEPGVRMYLSDNNSFVDMNLDKLMGLYYTLSNFNMYQSAITLLNFIQRPDFGTNRYFVGNSGMTVVDDSNMVENSKTGIIGRHIGCNGNISSLE